MDIDEITKKRIEKHTEYIWSEVLNTEVGSKDASFAFGAHWSTLRILNILGIRIQNVNEFE